MSLRPLSRGEFAVNAAAAALLMPVYRRREWRSREATRAWQLKRIIRLVERGIRDTNSASTITDKSSRFFDFGRPT